MDNQLADVAATTDEAIAAKRVNAFFAELANDPDLGSVVGMVRSGIMVKGSTPTEVAEMIDGLASAWVAACEANPL